MSTTTDSRRRRRAAVAASVAVVGLTGILRAGWSVAAADAPPPPDTTTTTAAPDSTTTTAPPADTTPAPPGQSPTTTAPPPPTYTVNQPPSTTTTASGGGGGGGGGGGATTTTSGSSTSATSPATVGAGGVVWSDKPGTTPTAFNPLVVAVSTPTGGSISITKTMPSSSPSGYTALGQGAQISAPQASVSQPLTLTFDVSTSALPAGDLGGDVVVFRDGVAIQPCATSPATTAQPDPCVSGVTETPTDVTFTVLSSHASTWMLATPVAPRLAGADREATAAAVSQATFATGAAKAVVLARDDAYPDALAGAPLAVAEGGPLLLTSPGSLDSTPAQELSRVLPSGATVYLLGGTAALSDAVAQQVQSAGFKVTRLAGTDRFNTAVAIANAVPSPTAVLETTGLNFPDALTAATAAGSVGGVVLLTDGSQPAAATTAWIGSHAGLARYAVGGPAAQADPAAQGIVGADRYATAAMVAQQFFPAATKAGLASGVNFPDALAAGARLGVLRAPLLLTDPSTLSTDAAGFLNSRHPGRVEIYGGSAAVSDTVQQQAAAAAGG